MQVWVEFQPREAKVRDVRHHAGESCEQDGEDGRVAGKVAGAGAIAAAGANTPRATAGRGTGGGAAAEAISRYVEV